jgi:glycosyltransferase involved in cell wall biosynthesis
MPLTILSVAYPLTPVGPDAVGGAEQILTYLDAALVSAGHRSIVVACEGSQTAGTLAPICISDRPLDEALAWSHEKQRNAIKRILEETAVDVVHMHGLNFAKCLPTQDVPVVATLHLPAKYYPAETFQLTRAKTFLQCVSSSQRALCPEGAPYLPEIENGVPFTGAHTPPADRKFCVALGRVCPEKGFHLAIDAAERARIPLVIGGQVFSFKTHRDYFAEQIAPRCNGLIRFLGPVDMMHKRRLLAAARCLLVTSLVPETSSLVAMEALACGTPVIAFPSGALAEIVEHGRTGFLVKDVHAMAAAASLDVNACFEAARTRFSLERMIERYFEMYRRLAKISSHKKAQKEQMQTQPHFAPLCG